MRQKNLPHLIATVEKNSLAMNLSVYFLSGNLMVTDEFTNRANEMLRTDGYPLPKFADDGMYLKGSLTRNLAAIIGVNQPRELL